MVRSLVFGRPGATGVDIGVDDPYVAARHMQVTQADTGTFFVTVWCPRTWIDVYGPLPAPQLGRWRTVPDGMTLPRGSRLMIGRTVLPWVVDR